MPRVLYVMPDKKSADKKFEEILKFLDVLDFLPDRESYAERRIDIEFGQYTFEVMDASQNLEMKLRGKSFNKILIDEEVELTDEQKMYLKIVERNW